MGRMKIAPSILGADPMHLDEEICKAIAAGCDELHVDVMDGHFVPNLSFGPHVLAAMKKAYGVTFDVHLMLDEPLHFLAAFMEAGADVITVHAEARRWELAIEQIRRGNIRAGVSLKPHTSVGILERKLDQIDRVLLMTVEPGFGGQRLMEGVLNKVDTLRQLGFRGEIEVDGGVNLQNLPMLAQKDIDILVMGTAFFGAEMPQEVVREIHSL